VTQFCGSSRFRRLFLGDGEPGVGGGMSLSFNSACSSFRCGSLSLCERGDDCVLLPLLSTFRLMSVEVVAAVTGVCVGDTDDGDDGT
jgi:hypothetical protein